MLPLPVPEARPLSVGVYQREMVLVDEVHPTEIA